MDRVLQGLAPIAPANRPALLRAMTSVVRAASAEIMRVYDGTSVVRRKADHSPLTEADLAATPTFFIGTPTSTWRFGLGVSGQKGSFGLKGTGGLHAISNNGHVEGSSTTRFEGRIQMTIGFSTGGPSKGRQ